MASQWTSMALLSNSPRPHTSQVLSRSVDELCGKRIHDSHGCARPYGGAAQ